jgi:hypothetical protein
MVEPFSPSTDSRGSPTSTGRVSSPWLTPTSALCSKPSIPALATTSVDPIHDLAYRDAICELYGWPQTFVGRLPG